ncbi:MAG: PhzF family phenazine biosynthesis protein [Phycisphaerales bacterium]
MPTTTPGELTVYQIDSFTRVPFRGNPAAVCLVERALEESVMQQIAAEMNLSETAFVEPVGGATIDPSQDAFNLRWFTPTMEVELCGHATLASAFVLFESLGVESTRLRFETRKRGSLFAERDSKLDGAIRLDFPIDRFERRAEPADIVYALGVDRIESFAVGESTYSLVEVDNPDEVRSVTPDFDALRTACESHGVCAVIVTARDRGGDADFVSRFFGPCVGVNEDPVTGSAHCLLAAWWRDRLGQSEFRARQVSVRGGELTVRVREDGRVDLVGHAVLVMRGVIRLP